MTDQSKKALPVWVSMARQFKASSLTEIAEGADLFACMLKQGYDFTDDEEARYAASQFKALAEACRSVVALQLEGE